MEAVDLAGAVETWGGFDFEEFDQRTRVKTGELGANLGGDGHEITLGQLCISCIDKYWTHLHLFLKNKKALLALRWMHHS